MKNILTIVYAIILSIGLNSYGWAQTSGWQEVGTNDITYMNGKVGIGTDDLNDNNFNLFVSKGILTERVNVKQDGTWPDYVFDDDYQLMSLENLKAYIEAHRHLPGVTSAKEVEENGLNIIENQRALLEKIEVLYLYLISQRKEILELQKQIEEEG